MTIANRNQVHFNQQARPGWRVVGQSGESHPIDDGLPSRDAGGANPRRKWKSLRRVWQQYLRPRLTKAGRKKATLAEYETHLRGWEQFWQHRREKRLARVSVVGTEPQKTSGKTKVTCGPPVHQITESHLADFQLWLMGGRRPKKNLTINNYIKSIRAILHVAKRRKLIPEVPEVSRLPARKSARKVRLSYEHLDAIYRSCDAAPWPLKDRFGRPMEPARFWRAAIVMYFNFGFRTQELISLGTNKRGLTWGNIVSDEVSPGVTEAVNEHGWLFYVPTKQEATKPEPLVLAISPMVRMHLNSIRPINASPEDPIFPFPYCSRSFRQAWRKIVFTANVRPKAALRGKAGMYLVKDLRKTCVTWHNHYDRGIAPFIVGHANRNSDSVITSVHYDSPELATQRALLKLPQPPAFEAIRNTNQLKLF